MVNKLELQRKAKDVVIRRYVKKTNSYLDNSQVDYQGNEGVLYEAESLQRDDISSIQVKSEYEESGLNSSVLS